MAVRVKSFILVAAAGCCLACSLEPRYELDGGPVVGERRSREDGSAAGLDELARSEPSAGESGGALDDESEVGATNPVTHFAPTGRNEDDLSPSPASAPRLDGGLDLCVPDVHAVPPEGAVHLTTGEPLTFLSNPPASGAHYASGAPYKDYGDVVIPRGYWLHNLELGGMALLHGPAADAATVDELRAVYATLPLDPACDSTRSLLTMDPELDDAVAVVGWEYVLEASCVNPQAIVKFVLEHRGHGMEDRCDVDAL